MSIQILTIGTGNSIQDRINKCLMFLDMGDRSQIPEGKAIIFAINRALRRKNTPDEIKALKALRDELRQKIKELS